MGRAVRILLVEDNEVYRSSLELLLGMHAGLEVVGSVADGRAAVDACAGLQPDVVLMDFRLPGMHGADATGALREACPSAAVVCLTAEATAADEDALVDAGVVALVRKGESTENLVSAIRAAAGEVEL